MKGNNKRHDFKHGTIYEAQAEDVYPLLTPGSVTLVHSDGPYAVGKADWDRMKVADLAAWYRPHIEAWGRLCAPSASIYHWGTAEGWATVHPEYLRQGWTFRALVIWDKGQGLILKSNPESLRTWPTVTEMCGFYQREGFAAPSGAAQTFAYAAGASDDNQIRKWLCAERARAGLTDSKLEEAVNACGGKGHMICRHSFAKSQWVMPTLNQWIALHAAWNTYGDPSGRPYLQRDLSRMYDVPSVQTEYEALRVEYEAVRAPFTLPPGTTNVWTVGQVQGSERMTDNAGTLHPCQKPLKFADRIVRASSRPGDLILEPFGGTCRIAVACEQLARYKPADARRYVCVEMNADGVDYIGPVLKHIQEIGKQVTLFEGLKQSNKED